MSRLWVCALAVLGLVVVGGSGAAAQSNRLLYGYGTVHVGTTAGGDVPDKSGAFGGSVAIVEDSGWGAELDLGRVWGDTQAGHSVDVTTIMVNASWIGTPGVVRPFINAGAGLMRLDGCLSGCLASSTANDFGLNAGGGAYLRFNDIIGLRGDGRYFWAPGDHPEPSRRDHYGFWRISLGVTFMWATEP